MLQVVLNCTEDCREAAESSKGTRSRTAVVLFHGLTGMPAEMRPVSRHLEKMGFQVHTPLLAGHGGDDATLLGTTWKDWIAGARQAIESATAGCDRLVVGGLSMGSSIACYLAARDARIAGLIMLSTTLRYDGDSLPATSVFLPLLPLVDLFPILGRVCHWTENPPYGLKDERLQRQISKAIEAARSGESNQFGLFRTYAASLRQMSLLVEQVRASAGRVRCPALIIHSLEDTMTSLDNATEIYARLASRDKSIVFLSGCDHVITLDLQKQQVVSLVGAFVDRVAEQPRKEGTAWQAA